MAVTYERAEVRLQQCFAVVEAEPCSTTQEIATELGLTRYATHRYLMQLWREDKIDFRRAHQRRGAPQFVWTVSTHTPSARGR